MWGKSKEPKEQTVQVDDGRWHAVGPHVAFSAFASRPTTYRARMAQWEPDAQKPAKGTWHWRSCSHKHKLRVDAVKCAVASADEMNKREGK
jgi:hypothetical protein